MEKVGNFKTISLIRSIIVIYSIVSLLVFFIFYLLKKIPGISPENLEDIDDWGFYLGKSLPIISVSVVLYYIDKFFDKLPSISSLLFEVPNLKGEYEGLVKQKDGNEYKVTASIIQTLSNAEFELKSPKGSVSTSQSISFEKSGMKNWEIFINYKNFNPETPEDPKNYEGTCRLKFDSKTKTLTGSYYTSRQIFGTLELKKII